MVWHVSEKVQKCTGSTHLDGDPLLETLCVEQVVARRDRIRPPRVHGQERTGPRGVRIGRLAEDVDVLHADRACSAALEPVAASFGVRRRLQDWVVVVSLRGGEPLGKEESGAEPVLREQDRDLDTFPNDQTPHPVCGLEEEDVLGTCEAV